MKAIQIDGYGGPEVLQLKDIPRPVAQKGQILVDVHAAGLNPFDLKILSGAYKDMIPLQFPLTFGGDFSGTVVQIGEDVSDYQIGNEVYGTAIALSGGSGAYAQMAVVHTQKVAIKPTNISFLEAAALPVAGLTAVEAIADLMKVEKGQKILIHGGAGGVGHMAIQYAILIGAYVTTTVRGSDSDYVKSLGAHEVIDFETQAFEKLLKDVDAVLDTVGGNVSEKSYQVLKKGGTLVLLSSQVNETVAHQHGVVAIRQMTKTDAPQLKRLTTLVENGIIKVHIDRVFALEQVRDAFVHLQSGHPRGKVILTI